MEQKYEILITAPFEPFDGFEKFQVLDTIEFNFKLIELQNTPLISIVVKIPVKNLYTMATGHTAEVQIKKIPCSCLSLPIVTSGRHLCLPLDT